MTSLRLYSARVRTTMDELSGTTWRSARHALGKLSWKSILLILALVALSDPAVASCTDVPDGFTSFELPEHPDKTHLLNHYLWYHFSNRIFGEGTSGTSEGRVLYPQEYITTTDMWLNNALRPGWSQTIQPIHRQNLLGIRISPEGYVWSHQHFSYAHDLGWPFPAWSQAGPAWQGLTAGWHFQYDEGSWVFSQILHLDPDTPYVGERATLDWDLSHVRSLGIVDGKWRLESTGLSPTITWPKGVNVDADNAPFLQLRWKRTPAADPGNRPYIEWMRDEDDAFSSERRMYFGVDGGNPLYESVTGTTHSLIPVHRHPLWEGKIARVRIALALGERGTTFDIDSFFTVYDTRHVSNNTIYIQACWNYFRWTQDLAFLREAIDRMRLALRYQQTVMGGLQHNHIRNEWPGHDGRPGFTLAEDGTKTFYPGRSIGSNYFDLLPFGWDDMYATAHYYGATLVMAELEEAILAHPEWDVHRGAPALAPAYLRRHAAAVKETANAKFWNPETGRFVACIDEDGVPHDYGYTFVNLEAIFHGMASVEHAESIMDWLTGKRRVEGDTSTGDDIYRWRLGPRASTRRNVDWYQWVWTSPEDIPWGGQIQDGGSVLGFTYYDLYARLQELGPDNAWARLEEILDWEADIWDAGGYRTYYADGEHGTTLQGGGPPGGIGIDHEFVESALLPSILVYGFLGLKPVADALEVEPRLPHACPEMTVRNLHYLGNRLDVTADRDSFTLTVKDNPSSPLWVRVGARWTCPDAPVSGHDSYIGAQGEYRFVRVSK